MLFRSNDYGNGSFDVAIDIVRDGYDLRIDFLATLTCQSLQNCIKQGVAKFVYHLECAQTGFRTVVQTDKVSEVYTLLNKAVNGKLQICPFVHPRPSGRRCRKPWRQPRGSRRTGPW